MALQGSLGHADRSLPPALARLDLTPLYGNCLLRSDVRRETYDCIASKLCDYGLSWQGGAVDARAYAATTGRVSFTEIQYGDEVTITPQLYDGFVLARVSVKNGIEIEADGSVTHVPEGGVFFSAPRASIRLRWQAQCRQLLIRIPADALGTSREGVARRSGSVLEPSLVPLFLDQVNLALGIGERGSELPNCREWISHAETGLARFAAMHLSGGLSQPRRDEFAARKGSRDWPERLQGFIEARLNLPLMLDDLTRAVGLGRSQLTIGCQGVFACSPMQLVRRMRLDAARTDLERHPHQDLTMLALRYGFEHQSRFAKYYRQRFHELPRDTRIRCIR